MDNWLLFPIRDLSGGMNLAVSPFQGEKDEMKYLINWGLEYIGALLKVPGYSARGDAVSGVTSILGLTNYYYGDNIKQIAIMQGASDADAYLYDPNDGSWDAQGMSLTSQSKPEFATFLDGLFMVNYEDATRFYNGTTWSTSTNVTNAPKARTVIPFGDRLYLGNLDIGGTAHESRVGMSSLPDDSYNITWDMSDTGNWFDVQPKDGDKIKALGKNNSRLLIFKEETLWRYDTNSLYQFPGAPGTNNCRSVANILGLGWTLYFHKSGIYGIRGNETTLLSRKIEPIIKGVSSINLDKICAFSMGDYYFLYLGDIANTYDNIYIENCVVVMDMARYRVYVRQLAHQPTVFAPYRDDRSELVYDDASVAYDMTDKTYNGLVSAQDYMFFGADNGRVYQLDTSATFAGEPISAKFESHNYYPAGIHARTQLQALKFYTQNCRRIRLYASVDDAPWRPITRYTQNEHEIYYEFPTQIQANRIKFRGTENSSGIKSALLGIDVFHTPLGHLI